MERLIDLPNEWQQINSTLFTNVNHAGVLGASSATLYFEASSLLPVGGQIFRINREGNCESRNYKKYDAPLLRTRDNSDIIISNGLLLVHCDR